MKKFSPVSKVYKFATENLHYMDHFQFIGKHVLSVGGSGDQMLEAYRRGAAQVTCFDINLHAQFLVELKLAALHELNRVRFLDLLLNEHLETWYPDIRSCLTSSAQLFFDNHMGSLTFTEHTYVGLESFIPYLSSDLTYEELQRRLPQNLIWHALDISTAANKLVGPWDIILLSNIADYSHQMYPSDDLHVETFYTHNVQPWLSKLVPGGKLVYAYIYDIDNLHGSDQRNCFNNAYIRASVYSNVPGFNNYQHEFNSVISTNTHDAVGYLEQYL